MKEFPGYLLLFHIEAITASHHSNYNQQGHHTGFDLITLSVTINHTCQISIKEPVIQSKTALKECLVRIKKDGLNTLSTQTGFEEETAEPECGW